MPMEIGVEERLEPPVLFFAQSFNRVNFGAGHVARQDQPIAHFREKRLVDAPSVCAQEGGVRALAVSDKRDRLVKGGVVFGIDENFHSSSSAEPTEDRAELVGMPAVAGVRDGQRSAGPSQSGSSETPALRCVSVTVQRTVPTNPSAEINAAGVHKRTCPSRPWALLAWRNRRLCMVGVLLNFEFGGANLQVCPTG